MEDVKTIKRICDIHRLFVATAESVTVGHLQTIIGAVSGASTFFRGGITAYNIEEKVRVLGVERAHAESVDCVSPQVAAEMAQGATRILGADLGIATTGYAEPPDSSGSSLPYAFYAIWDRGEAQGNPVRSGRLTSQGTDRVETQRVFANHVLRELAAYLISREAVATARVNVFRVERLPNGLYRLGENVVNDLSSVERAIKAVKNPIPITAVQINQPFEVVTTEGIMKGRAGDWVIQGVVGEVYVCPQEVFRRSYSQQETEP